MAGVSTSMDQLVELLEDTKEVKLTDAVRALGTTKERVESWAKILEKEGVIELHYSVIGGAIIRRGVNYDSVMKASQKAAKQPEVKAPEPSPQLEKRAEPIVPPAPQRYLLIRKKIQEEEDLLEKDLHMLREEQAKVIEYTSAVMEEGNKLAEYIEELRRIAEQKRAPKPVTKPQQSQNSGVKLIKMRPPAERASKSLKVKNG